MFHTVRQGVSLPFLNEQDLSGDQLWESIPCPSGICQVNFACAQRHCTEGWRLGTAATSSSLDTSPTHSRGIKEKLYSKSRDGAPGPARPHSNLEAPTKSGFQHKCSSCALAEKLNFSKREPLAAPSPRVCCFKGVCFYQHPLTPPPSGTPTRRSTRTTRHAKRAPTSAKRIQFKHVL